MSRNVKIFLLFFFVSLPFWWGINLFQENLEKFFYAQISQPFEEMIVVQLPKRFQKTPPELNVKSAISLKIDKRGKKTTLFQKNPEEILPIASLTKLMTAVIFLESTPLTTQQGNFDLENTWITISPEAANQEDVPVYGNLKAGEKLTIKQLLELMLIYSSNDAAFALAELGGLDFVKKMNQKAEELGLKNTHFANPTGLDPENLSFSLETTENFNYSTAKDLIKLGEYILTNHPIIFEISSKKSSYLIKNGLSDLVLPENFTFLGGKTGYTTEAGECLLVVFQDERGFIFLNLILGAKKETRVIEMQKLINWLTNEH